MNMFGLMDTSGEAMQAERMRAEVVAANMANAETTRTDSGGPYRRQHVVFAANQGDSGFLDSMNAASGTPATGSLASATLPSLDLSGTGTAAPGVHIAQVVEDTSAPLKRYDPGHPDAGPDGYVSYPDINPLTEMVDLMGATRAYGLNSSAVQAEKGMITSALEIAKS
ncbi:MAG: flagellar basal body rod protein FlgC [Terracidiphilus sp.]|nr:flagellar basal body rod protein FlgC [Terracidiphilus sp.]